MLWWETQQENPCESIRMSAKLCTELSLGNFVPAEASSGVAGSKREPCSVGYQIVLSQWNCLPHLKQPAVGFKYMEQQQ